MNYARAAVMAAIHNPEVAHQIIKKAYLIPDPDLRELLFSIPDILSEGLTVDISTMANKNKGKLALINEIQSLNMAFGGEYSPANWKFYLNQLQEEFIDSQKAALPGRVERLLKNRPLDEAVAEIERSLAEIKTGSPKKRNVKRFQIKALKDIEFTPPKYIVNGHLEEGVTAAIIGASGSKKSFYGIGLGCSVASGEPFFGKEVRKPGPVIFIIGEGKAGFKRRIQAWGIVHQIDTDLIPVFISTVPVELTNPESVTDLLEEIECVSEKHGEPKLIIFDTLNRNFGAADENSTSDMTKAIGGLDRIRIETGATVLTVHHTGHGNAGRARGSSVLYASMDVEFLLEDNNGTVVVKNTKSKDAPPVEEEAFELNTVFLGVYDDDNQEVTSAILRKKDTAAPIVQKRKTQKELAFDILEKELKKAKKAHITEVDWRNACMKSGIGRTRFYDHRKALLSDKKIQLMGGLVSVSDLSCTVRGVYPPDTPDMDSCTGNTGNSTGSVQLADKKTNTPGQTGNCPELPSGSDIQETIIPIF